MNSNCAKNALPIKTIIAGKDQITHPSVLYFERPWNGYQYYLAYTPYPYQDGGQENPCIAVSNNGIDWINPSDLKNPIATCYEDNCDELKDPELVFNSDKKLLELWYLGRINSSLAEGGPLYVFRKISADGRNWSEREIIYCYKSFRLISPSVIYENGTYKFWGFRHDSTEIALYYMESEDNCKTWSEMIRCHVSTCSTLGMWHGTVRKINYKYLLIWCGSKHAKTLDKKRKYGQDIFLSESNDGIIFTDDKSIINNTEKWAYFYRPTILFNGQHYFIYYGLVRLDDVWLIGLSYGNDLKKLIGLKSNTIDDLWKPINDNIKRKRIKDTFPCFNDFIKSYPIYFFISIIFLYKNVNLIFLLLFSMLIHILFEQIRTREINFLKIFICGIINIAIVNLCYSIFYAFYSLL